MVQLIIIVERTSARRKRSGQEQATSYSGSTSSTYSLEFFNTVVLPRNIDSDLGTGSQETYHTIWKNFLKFTHGFDRLPDKWEDKMLLYAAYLSDTTHKPATIETYMSAIKYKLIHDGYPLNEDRVKLQSIVRSSRIKNRKVHNRMPINRRILKNLIDAIGTKFHNQPYLAALYKCMFTLAYFGLLRVGEMVKGTHPILAGDVHASRNKNPKIQLVLRSSKTHGLGDRPQIIRIPNKVDEAEIYKLRGTKYCPFTILDDYLKLRGNYQDEGDQFFVFRSGDPVKDGHFRRTLKSLISVAGYQNEFYSSHSFRSGRADDLRQGGVEILTIQKIGRWKSERSLARYFL